MASRFGCCFNLKSEFGTGFTAVRSSGLHELLENPLFAFQSRLAPRYDAVRDQARLISDRSNTSPALPLLKALPQRHTHPIGCVPKCNLVMTGLHYRYR
ncbi:MAG: hypothetical protein HC840_11605 [Leptolyngbyaceae cyanobacterium RM2_2_4]|nr:hypothetical protein [Leptolyngbyaceae cyanobacterium RM2_2_4]